jgi:hypothetical protein
MNAQDKPWRPMLSDEQRRQLDSPDPGLDRHFDREGRPMALSDFVEAYEDPDYKIVAQDEIGTWLVSTVWLGLNFQFGEGDPLIFETMAFDQSPDGKDKVAELMEKAIGSRPESVPLGEAARFMRRYSTEADALRGHQEAVAAANAGLIRR